MSYNNIFFDVDGTIIDSREGITESVQYALKNFNIIEDDLKKLDSFIGPPLFGAFKKYYNFDDEQAEKAVEYFREYYKDIGISKNCLYDGILDVIKNLKDKNKRLIIATSKPELFTEKILKSHDIYKYFDFVSAATLDQTRTKKEDIIKYAIDKLKINSVEDCIMIGDKHQDIIGANKNNMDSIGVLYGFGSLEELETQNPNYIINKTYEILKIV